MKSSLPSRALLWCIPLCLGAIKTDLSGADLVLKDGRKLTQAEFITDEENRVKIKHDAGIVWVTKSQVPIEFLKENGATVPVMVDEAVNESKKQDELLQRLRAAFPTFKDKDGKVHDSAKITAIEPTGIKLVIDSAVTRLPFHKLPGAVASFLGMNGEAVARAREEIEQRQALAREDNNLRMTATSILARQKCQVQLEIVQYEKDGYICYGTVLERKVKQEDIQVDYDRLNRRKVMETQNQISLEEGRDLGRMKVYGLPTNLVGKKLWRGELWLGGTREVETAQGETVTTRDGFTALQSGVEHLVKHGLGNLTEDLSESKRTAESIPEDPFGNPMRGTPGQGAASGNPFAPADPFAPGSFIPGSVPGIMGGNVGR